MANDYSSGDGERPTPQERVQLPGIFLMIVGILNLLASVWMLVGGITTANKSDDELKAEARLTLDQIPRESRDKLSELIGKELTPELLAEANRQAVPITLAWGAISTGLAVLAILGGVKMRRLRGYGLALSGSILVAIPCLSPMGCCLMGEVIGIWCLVVLLSRDVSSAFGGPYPYPPDEQGSLRHD